MSGRPWTPERKAAFSAAMKARWREGQYARRRPAVIDERERQARSARAKALNVRIRNDEVLQNKVARGQRKVRRDPKYREIQAAVMRELMARPEMRRQARFHCIKINKNPKVRKRQWASRRKKAKELAGQARRREAPNSAPNDDARRQARAASPSVPQTIAE